MTPSRFSKKLGICATLAVVACVCGTTLAGTDSKKIKRLGKKGDKPNTAPANGTRHEDSQSNAPAYDPLEKINRGTFAFNHQLYRFIGRPVAKTTEFLIPKPVLKSVGNAFDNLKSPVRITSSLLQGKFERAGKETAKLVVNSTLGVGGLFRASDRIAALRSVPTEDVGQAFGKWGVPPGPYLVVPVLGPSSTRDLVGRAADIALDPVTWIHGETLRVSIQAGDVVQSNPGRLRIYDSTVDGALDPYIAVRDGFLNFRAEAVVR